MHNNLAWQEDADSDQRAASGVASGTAASALMCGHHLEGFIVHMVLSSRVKTVSIVS